jgi:hypothetical protein
VENEQKVTLRDGLISLCVGHLPLAGPEIVIRTDAAPGFASLLNDKVLSQHSVRLEVGREKNINKNPVAERAIQELERELLRHEPRGGPVNHAMLAVATATLNSRVRDGGLSARELWTQRDQYTGEQIPVSDRNIIMRKHKNRHDNHSFSEQSKCPKGKSLPICNIAIGDLVFLNSEGSKLQARDRYLVVDVQRKWIRIRKFVGDQLRSKTYSVLPSDCYKVPADTIRDIDRHASPHDSSSSDGDIETDPVLPEIPSVISSPYCDTEAVGKQHDGGAVGNGSHYNDQDREIPRRSIRVRRPPAYLRDYV